MSSPGWPSPTCSFSSGRLGRGQREVRTHLGQWSETRSRTAGHSPRKPRQPGSWTHPRPAAPWPCSCRYGREALAVSAGGRERGSACTCDGCAGRGGGGAAGCWSCTLSWCPSQTQSGGERDERALGLQIACMPAVCSWGTGGNLGTARGSTENQPVTVEWGRHWRRRLERTVTPGRELPADTGPLLPRPSLRAAGAPCPPRPRPSHPGRQCLCAQGKDSSVPRCCRHVPATSLGFGKRGRRELGNSIKG